MGRTTLHNLMNYQLTIVFSRGSLYLTVASNLLFSLLLYTAFGTITQIWLLSAHYLVIARIRDCVSILQGQEAGADCIYFPRSPPGRITSIRLDRKVLYYNHTPASSSRARAIREFSDEWEYHQIHGTMERLRYLGPVVGCTMPQYNTPKGRR